MTTKRCVYLVDNILKHVLNAAGNVCSYQAVTRTWTVAKRRRLLPLRAGAAGSCQAGRVVAERPRRR